MRKKCMAALLLLLSMVLVSCSDDGAQTQEADTSSTQPVPEAPIDAPLTEPTDVPPAEPSPPEPVYLTYVSEENYFTLPLQGATGYAAGSLNVRAEPTTQSEQRMTLAPGEPFRILSEEGDWWQVDVDGLVGYVYHPYAMINLPDVLPTAVYHNTNASASVLQSSFTAIPNVTGQQLYAAYGYNERLGREEFIMPVLYGTAKKIAHAQHLALQDGNTLINNELYRPYETQRKIVTELQNLSAQNAEVAQGITAAPWSISWFIATGLSNHQRGYAIDTSLGVVTATERFTAGDYAYEAVVSYEEHPMPTPIHELSYRSASLAYPVSSLNDTDWRGADVSPSFTEGARMMRDYCTAAGLTPLASEWWHFNDLARAQDAQSRGDYFIDRQLSVPPLA